MATNMTTSLTDKSQDRQDGTFTRRILRSSGTPRYSIKVTHTSNKGGLYAEKIETTAKISIKDLVNNVKIRFNTHEDMQMFMLALSKAGAQFDNDN